MPCNSDYLNSTWSEQEATKLFQVLDEVTGNRRVNPDKWGDGYDDRAYGKAISKRQRDAMVKQICDVLTASKHLHKYSLEVQTWWRDHQEADAKRRPKNRKTLQKR